MDQIKSITDVLMNTSNGVWNGVKTIAGIWPQKTATDPLSKPLVSTTRAMRLSEMATRREVLALLQASHWTRMAAIFGASAVAMGAYGAHDMADEYKTAYETANKYHFFHSLALLAVPLTRRPLIVGTLMTIGMCVFCGTCYTYSLTQNKEVIRYTPFGGLTLILAWLSMLL
ncbi:unnamed protein product [Medioppia subpectinata]|uniref:Uncharacterized protein n=1 Tax=Medioppia subpectinata TaxID=1979941 RepID=A0A7R9KRE9_9ACAR|nr:unnamed protein product [Medioppia subpectinata]CAG2108410.1 unnamed protein product [Medioppia subpectinata]